MLTADPMPVSRDQEAAASAAPPSGLKFRGHIPALDGLRGIAILMVLMLHFYNEAAINAQYPLLGPVITKLALSGLYGVQLFFVLSGFLITGIHVDSKGGNKYFRNFYMRRFLRIFPLYYGTLCVLFLILPHVVVLDEGAKDIASRQGWLWTYLSNLPWSGSNWDSSNVFRLGHFWSLCVEEHFYVLWPLVVYACSKQKLVRLCVVIMACCLLVRLIHTVADGPRLFAWSSIRKLDGLALGSLLAASLREGSLSFQLSRYAPGMVTVFGCMFTAFVFVPRHYMSGYYWAFVESISVILFGFVLMLVLQPVGILPSLMRQRWLIAFGKYSYGIYVVHNLCLPLFRYLFNPECLLHAVGSPLLAQGIFYTLTVSASFLLAFLSWHLWEKHFLKLKRFFEYGRAESRAGTTRATAEPADVTG